MDTLSGFWDSVVLENGTTVMTFTDNETIHFLSCDAQGEPVRRISVPIAWPYTELSIAARPGGGFYAVALVADSVFGLAWDPDSLVGTFELYGFNNAGTMDLRREFSTGFVIESFDNLVANILCDGSGLYISVNRGNEHTEELRLLHTTLSGDLLWAKSYVIEGYGMVSLDQYYKLAMDGTGGIYFARRVQFDASATVVIGRIDADGNLIWQKGAGYEVSPYGFIFGELVVRADGTPVLVGVLLGAGMLAVAPDGSSVEAHIYDLPEGFEPHLRAASAAPDGSLAAVSNHVWTYNALGYGLILHVGADFGIVHVRSTDIVPIDQALHGLRPNSITHSADRAVILGNMLSKDTVFNTTVWHPAMWNVDLTTQEGCMLIDPVVTHFPVPQDLINWGDREQFPVHDFDALWSILTPESTVETPFTTNDMCSLLVGTPEHSDRTDAMEVYPNPSTCDGVINLRCPDAARFTVYSATGAVLLNISSAIGLTTSFSTPGLAAGLYPVVAFDANGQRVAGSKLEVR